MARDSAAESHKQRVALSSIAGAILLTTMKLVVGIATGSLGILAEAAHSGLDLVAALMTYLAVRVSGHPADREHPYGHGKVENLSALFETVLLVVTCVWIIYEGIQRLFFKSVTIEANAWAFVTMAVSIAVDMSRSRALAHAAKKYDSQALEADALHFSTDIWSSSVVIGGLVMVRIAEAFPGLRALAHADAVAALGVAAIVLYVSAKLGGRTVSVLLDTAPTDLSASVAEQVRRLPQVHDVRQMRVRRAGPDAFVDLTMVVAPNVTLAEAHGIASQVEGMVQSLIPRADVVVHIEPSNLPANGHETVLAALREAAKALNLNIHGLRILRIGDNYHVEAHAEIASSLNVAQAHEIISRFEQAARNRLPSVGDIITHIEPVAATSTAPTRAMTELQIRTLAAEAEQLAESMWGPGSCHQMQVHTIAGRPSLSMHCTLSAELGIDRAHELTEAFEDALRQRYPALDRVLVHAEPPSG
ncbi:MAG: cation diffusion facilitator family transporter [Anaerolineae bacterium]